MEQLVLDCIMSDQSYHCLDTVCWDLHVSLSFAVE